MMFTGNYLDSLLIVSWVGALLTTPSVLLQRAGRPAAALSWLLALFALPALSLLAWWLFGRTHLQRKSKRRRRASLTTAHALSQTRRRIFGNNMVSPAVKSVNSNLAYFLPLEISDAVFPATSGNQVRLLENAESVQQTLFRLIQEAEHHLHLLFYIWRDDRSGRAVRDQLVEKAAQGVAVRVLYDAIGSLSLPKNFFDSLVRNGGQVAAFMPIRLLSMTPTVNFRNHRKILVADGEHAYTGGINIGDEYYGWKDIGISIQGPGVNQLQEVFVDDWRFTTGEELTTSDYFCGLTGSHECTLSGKAVCETIASGPDQAFNATREMVFLAATQCRYRLWIATPYFVPDVALILALRTAVYRGVDVRLFLPAHSDSWLVRRASRVFYGELLQGGVRIFEYQGMLHAKAILLDSDSVLIGSANLDNRSFRLNFESSTFVIDRTLNSQLKKFFDSVLTSSNEVNQQVNRQATYISRLQDALAHLLSPLL